MDDFILRVLSSLVGGSLTAVIFFIVFRPRLTIADKIARLKDNEGVFYKFKFYNTSLFRAVDVKPTLFWGTSKEASDNNVHARYEQLELTRTRPFTLPEWKRTTKKTKYASHCVTIRCINEDFDKLLKDYGDFLEFRINVKHGFSNISVNKKKIFNRVECVEDGEFEFGNSTKIS